MSTRLKREFLIFGYLRDQRFAAMIGQLIPKDIPMLIAEFYPICIDFTQNAFDLTLDEKELLTKWLRSQLLDNDEQEAQNKFLTSTLLYDSQNDGYKNQDYKTKCDKHPNKLTFVKTEYDHIFGGFISPITHSNYNEFFEDDKSFLFLLRSKFKDHTPKICKIEPKSADKAYLGAPNLGPIFGEGEVAFLIDSKNLTDSHFVSHRTSHQNVSGNELCGGVEYDPAPATHSFAMKIMQTFRIDVND